MEQTNINVRKSSQEMYPFKRLKIYYLKPKGLDLQVAWSNTS